jgi:hypothetical protein
MLPLVEGVIVDYHTTKQISPEITSSVLEIFSFTVSFEYWTTGVLVGSEHYRYEAFAV